jgi:hypothetical protein
MSSMSSPAANALTGRILNFELLGNRPHFQIIGYHQMVIAEFLPQQFSYDARN